MNIIRIIFLFKKWKERIYKSPIHLIYAQFTFLIECLTTLSNGNIILVFCVQHAQLIGVYKLTYGLFPILQEFVQRFPSMMKRKVLLQFNT